MYQSASGGGLRSILVAPLILEGRLRGVVYLDSRIAKGMFTTADISLLTAITTHVAAALETARAAQLALAVQFARNERDVAERLRDVRRHLSATGSPASARISATASMVNGVWAAGLTAMVQSAAIAGPIFRIPNGEGEVPRCDQ